ncbi:DUF3429 domain-containing protein [Brevundimonas sp. BH3]|uniref:DUF3429 domain-containing protein n=1 Tax=Brevundimonas sp. BH3 TaxID=3133089 RepID=UPI00324CBD28
MTRAPRPAMILGWFGVLPFAGLTGALAVGLGDAEQIADALRLYGAVILSFMGGVHWGVATLRSENGVPPYGVSVLPALWAFAMGFTSPPIGLLGLAAGFLALLAYDLRCVRRGDLVEWYGRLRLWLTLAVILCLVVAGFIGS